MNPLKYARPACYPARLLAVFALARHAGRAARTNQATGRSQFLAAVLAGRGAASAPRPRRSSSSRAAGELPDDQMRRNMYANMGQKLAAQSEMPDIEWEFFVLDSQVINAFALPGGKVFISRGSDGENETTRRSSPASSATRSATSPPVTAMSAWARP